MQCALEGYDEIDAALDRSRQDMPGWAYAILKRACITKADDSSGYSREYLEEALAAAKKHLPGWASALIHQMAFPRAGARASAAARANPKPQLEQLDNESEPEVLKFDALADALAWYASNGGDMQARTIMLRARECFDLPGDSIGMGINTKTGGVAVLTKAAYGDVSCLVPSKGPMRPLIAFVGAMPSATDAARGEPFTGHDGAELQERYLAPLGLRKQDALLTNIVPMLGGTGDSHIFDGWIQGELDLYKPRIVVALGRVAKSALGDRADFFLPHPAAVRRSDGSHNEIAYRLRKIRTAIALAKALTRDVHICKSDKAEQIVYGVVLDPYQVDTQGDWIPAREIQQTAHDYMQNSRIVGLQHAEKADAQIVESHIVHYPSDADYQAARNNLPHKAYRIPYGDQHVHSGAWILGTKITDPEVWSRVEKGDIGAYSIGGSGVRTEIAHEQMPNVQFIELKGQMLPGGPQLPDHTENTLKADDSVNGHESPPKGYPDSKRQYADPANYKYPIDNAKHVRAAVSYFSKPANAGMYSKDQQKKIWGRIRRAAERFGIELADDTGT